jgi:broad specificity phosphatase PhoE
VMIVSSPFLRCIQTAVQLAAAAGIRCVYKCSAATAVQQLAAAAELSSAGSARLVYT